MNKKLRSLVAAGAIVIMASSPVCAASVTMEDSRPESRAVTMDTKHSSGIFDTNSPAAENPNSNGDNNAAGPKITVKKSKFLVLKGEKFGFKEELGLNIMDATDGDITSQLAIPEIDTHQTGVLKKTVKAVNSKGEISTLDIRINIIDIKQSVSLKNAAELDNYDLGKLIIGDKSGLTVSLGNKSGNSFTLNVTDGVSKINKNVMMQIGESSDSKDENKNEATTPDKDSDQTTDNKNDGTTNGGTTDKDKDKENNQENSQSNGAGSNGNTSSENNSTTGENSQANGNSSSSGSSNGNANGSSSNGSSSSANGSNGSSNGTTSNGNSSSSNKGNGSASLPKTGAAVAGFGGSVITLLGAGLAYMKKRG